MKKLLVMALLISMTLLVIPVHAQDSEKSREEKIAELNSVGLEKKCEILKANIERISENYQNILKSI
jgi:hypothetical protein